MTDLLVPPTRPENDQTFTSLHVWKTHADAGYDRAMVMIDEPVGGNTRGIAGLQTISHDAVILAVFRALAIVSILVLPASVSRAAVVRVPLATRIDLKPGEARTFTVETPEPAEIGWEAVQAKPCATSCVQATEVGGQNISVSMATRRGASKKYAPTDGRIAIEYKNVSTELVTINVYRVTRTCDAEACRFLTTDMHRSLVFKVDEFTSISTSQDGSYSIISGVAAGGRHFTFTAVWWTDEKPKFGGNCALFVQQYIDRHTPTVQYRPYVISGQRVGDREPIVLRSIDACVPRATKYGVAEQNVFK